MKTRLELPNFTISESDKIYVSNWYLSEQDFINTVNGSINEFIQKSGMDVKYVKWNKDVIIEDFIKGNYNKTYTKYLKKVLKSIK